MTRWARGKHGHNHKSSDGASWSQLRAGISGEGKSSDSLVHNDTSHCFSGGTRGNKKRQFHGNGLKNYRKHNRGMVTEEQDINEAVTIALKKNTRREHRRIKRQHSTKSSMVCFNCRKPGHGLADCPKADHEEMGTGICFRCGSTEHEIQKCRAKIDPAMGDYPYAKCFICGKTGHISRSCPDNPRGLYAAGGCCRVCGSVEHFQKDCPEHQASANHFTLGRLSNRISADHEDVSVPVKQVSHKKVKVVVY